MMDQSDGRWRRQLLVYFDKPQDLRMSRRYRDRVCSRAATLKSLVSANDGCNLNLGHSFDAIEAYPPMQVDHASPASMRTPNAVDAGARSVGNPWPPNRAPRMRHPRAGLLHELRRHAHRAAKWRRRCSPGAGRCAGAAALRVKRRIAHRVQKPTLRSTAPVLPFLRRARRRFFGRARPPSYCSNWRPRSVQARRRAYGRKCLH